MGILGLRAKPPRVSKGFKYLSDDGRVMVVIVDVRGGEYYEAFRKAFKVLGGLRKLISSGDKVVIKPNVGFTHSDAVTNPILVRDFARYIMDEVPNANIIIAESAVAGNDTSYCFESTGYMDALGNLDVKIVDLKRLSGTVKVRTDSRLIPYINVYELVYDADVLISMPMLKRHIEATVTISLKNMMGAIPDSEKRKFHLIGLSRCIALLNKVLNPDLAVIDATRIMAKSGPGHGEIIELNKIIISSDLVAADLIAAKMLFEAEGVERPLEKALNVKHIRLAYKLDIGTLDLSRIKIINIEV